MLVFILFTGFLARIAFYYTKKLSKMSDLGNNFPRIGVHVLRASGTQSLLTRLHLHFQVLVKVILKLGNATGKRLSLEAHVRSITAYITQCLAKNKDCENVKREKISSCIKTQPYKSWQVAFCDVERSFCMIRRLLVKDRPFVWECGFTKSVTPPFIKIHQTSAFVRF